MLKKSKSDLGYDATISWLEKRSSKNNEYFSKKLKLARTSKGETLFDMIIEMIKEHKHITLSFRNR